MNNLAGKIRAEIAKADMSYRAISERAKRAGYVLHFGTISTYASGKTKSYSREKLEAIAVGLGLPKDEFTKSADMPALGDPFTLDPEAALLEPHERDAVRRVVDAFIMNKRQRKQVMGNAEHPAPIGNVSETEDELALRREKAQEKQRPSDEQIEKMSAYDVPKEKDQSRAREEHYNALGEESQAPDPD